MFILVPYYGIKGAGLALLASEIAGTQGYKLVARKWLLENGLFWPKKQSLIAGFSVWVSAAGMALMIVFEQQKNWVLLISLVFLIVNIRYYWVNLPALVLEKAKGALAKIPVIKKIV
jgi:O-antigen/teichoic acid export membrane protein